MNKDTRKGADGTSRCRMTHDLFRSRSSIICLAAKNFENCACVYERVLEFMQNHEVALGHSENGQRRSSHAHQTVYRVRLLVRVRAAAGHEADRALRYCSTMAAGGAEIATDK